MKRVHQVSLVSIALLALLLSSLAGAVADEVVAIAPLDLSSPDSTYKVCRIIPGRTKGEDIRSRIELCLSENAQKELIVYLLLGSAMMISFHPESERQTLWQPMERILEKYNLERSFDEETADSLDALKEVEAPSVLEEMWHYLDSISVRKEGTAPALRDLEIFDDKASATEVWRNLNGKESSKRIFFRLVKEKWLIDGWKHIE